MRTLPLKTKAEGYNVFSGLRYFYIEGLQIQLSKCFEKEILWKECGQISIIFLNWEQSGLICDNGEENEK